MTIVSIRKPVNETIRAVVRKDEVAKNTPVATSGFEDEQYHPVVLAALDQHNRLNPENERISDWDVEGTNEPRQLWLHVRNRRVSIPAQGWKLHVSASVGDAHKVLELALPVLFAENATFKLCASSVALLHLNQGRSGLSQIGKFITIYPNSDEQAVRLAIALDKATSGFRAPSILSDRALTRGSLVHYRYGSFLKKHMHTKLGTIVSAYQKPDGEMTPDHRTHFYRKPDWALDPFEASGVAAPSRRPVRIVGNRYLIIAPQKESVRGVIYDAVDTVEPRRCIIKHARRNAAMTPDGRDACDRLRHEAAVLRKLLPNPLFPDIYGLHEEDGEMYLVMERIEGSTMEKHIRRVIVEHGMVPGDDLLRWARDLASALHTIHRAGFIYRDFKSSNILITPEGRLRMIDFELAYDPDGPLPQYNFGTRGFMSPQHKIWEAAHITDDIYSYGALLYFFATGAEPCNAPNDDNLLTRPIELLNPAVSPELASFIRRCIHPDRESRFASMLAVKEALAHIEHAYASSPAWGEAEASGEQTVAVYRQDARRLGESLCRLALPADNGQGLIWPGITSIDNTVAGDNVIQSRAVNVGVAGQVLALAELLAEFNDTALRRALEGGVRWLLSGQRLSGEPMAGLYLGEAGVAISLLRAGQVLGEPSIIEAASSLGKWVATLPHETPCMFTGTAGRLRHHLILWDATSDPEHLRHAMDCGELLLSQANPDTNNGISWIMPGEHGPGAPNVGYAHGAAGIGDALIDLYDATKDDRYRDAVAGACRWIAGMASSIQNDELDCLNWPRTERSDLSEGFWCHGAAGIGTFMLRAARIGAVDGAFKMAHRAAITVARTVRWAMPIHCHGLAGNIGFLLDMHQATGDPSYLAEANSLGELMRSFSTEVDGLFVFACEAPNKFSPTYTIGFSGIAMCLLRLADPSRRPQQISRAGFEYRPRR